MLCIAVLPHVVFIQFNLLTHRQFPTYARVLTRCARWHRTRKKISSKQPNNDSLSFFIALPLPCLCVFHFPSPFRTFYELCFVSSPLFAHFANGWHTVWYFYHRGAPARAVRSGAGCVLTAIRTCVSLHLAFAQTMKQSLTIPSTTDAFTQRSRRPNL